MVAVVLDDSKELIVIDKIKQSKVSKIVKNVVFGTFVTVGLAFTASLPSFATGALPAPAASTTESPTVSDPSNSMNSLASELSQAQVVVSDAEAVSIPALAFMIGATLLKRFMFA